MLDKTIVTHQNGASNNAQAFDQAFNIPNSDNQIALLQDKIRFYICEVARLEQELKNAQVLLKGHQTWLADVERKAEVLRCPAKS